SPCDVVSRPFSASLARKEMRARMSCAVMEFAATASSLAGCNDVDSTVGPPHAARMANGSRYRFFIYCQLMSTRVDLLHPKELAELGGLEFVAREVVEGFLSGLHRSPHRGFSVEF